MRLNCVVNGRPRQADDVWPGESLLYVLRERLGLPGAKNACEQGECGSCTVYLDGIPVCACLVAAGQAQDRTVTTVEGLTGAPPTGGAPAGTAPAGTAPAGTAPAGAVAPGDGQPLDPVQVAFVETGAIQCGFCTPGLIVAVHDLLARQARPSDPEIREALAGNLCRCTGYEKILDAVRLAAARRAES
nr:(2Fe-2S)-binding protein [Micromonospora sp. DSM 115978]